jgi:hypothetical protein
MASSIVFAEGAVLKSQDNHQPPHKKGSSSMWNLQEKGNSWAERATFNYRDDFECKYI